MASEADKKNDNDDNNDNKMNDTSTPQSTPQKPIETPTSKSSSKRKKKRTPPKESPAKSTKKVCACGRGMACAGMTQAFRLLGDVRCHFVELPRFRENPPSFKYQFRNNMRASYIRNLQKCNAKLETSEFDDVKKRRFVSLHHFQPQVVKAFYENPMMSSKSHRVPISITEHQVKEMGMKMDEEDRILSVNGNQTGGFYFVPNYTPTDVHQDLKDLVRSKRLVSERKSTPKKETPPKPTEVQFPNYSNAATPEQKSIYQHLQDQRKTREQTPKKEEVDQHLQQQRNQRQEQRQQLTPKKEEPVADDSSTEDVAEQDNDLEEVPSKDFDDIVAKTSEEGSNFDDLYENENDVGLAQKEDNAMDDDDGERDGPDESPPQRRKSEMSALTIDETDGMNEAALSASATKSEDSEEKGGDDQDEKEEAKPHEPMDKSIEKVEPIQRELFPEAAAAVSQDSDDHADSEMLQRVVKEEQKRKAHDDPSDLDNDMLAPATSEEDDMSNGSSPSKLAARNSDHPWDLSKYRTVELETRTKRSSATFIDPTTPTQSKDESIDSADPSHGMTPRKTPAGMDIIDEVARESSTNDIGDSHRSDSANNEAPQQYLDFYDDEEDAKARNKYHASFALSQSKSEESGEESKSDVSFSSEGVSPNAIGLTFELPGSDPTLRIQVHNDLIALESRRRSDISTLLNYHKEQWQTARVILLAGVENVDCAKRLVSGFAQAGMLFADSLEAISEDRFLDDRGKTVKSSFVQNRLKKRRSTQEYSIENRVKDDDFGESAMLKALIESQLIMAKTMDEGAQYLLDMMLPEVTDLKEDIEGMAAELEMLGEGIIGQLIASESEVKNIWDVFDALVTGDLMEYSVHGSSHGSMHGGSFHSVGSTSLHGMIPDSASVASNGTSPIKSKFKQLGTLGSIEDGWLVELIYKSAISCQKTVFEMAETELNKLYKEICIFEEKRLQKLHPLMIAFVPRQRRLFSAMPDAFKGVLDDLVGMRIDEESLQAKIDDTLQNRSRDRLAGSQKHRSSIMNRSRLKTVKDTPEVVNDIERLYGSPFFSSMIVLSKMLELKPSGLGGIVKSAYKLALVVVTSDGNFHVFPMPHGADASLEQSPLEAFRLLYPPMQFESSADWRRKADIMKQLSPSVSLNLSTCNIRVSNIRKREIDVIEKKEDLQQRNSFFGKKILKAVKDGGQGPTKCTLRLPTPADAAEWADELTKTKIGLGRKSIQWR